MNEFLRYSVEQCAFLIKGSGKMNGRDFADIVRQHFDNPRTGEMAQCIEDHIIEIVVKTNGCVELMSC